MEIELTVIAARNIKAGDVTGTSDAYIKILFKDEKHKTKVTKPTLNPDWNETFTIKAFKGDEITFQLYDKDKFSKDDYLGKIDYKIPQLIQNDTIYEIQKFDTEGVFYFSLKCISGGSCQNEKQNENEINTGESVILKISNINLKLYNFLVTKNVKGSKFGVRVGVESVHTPQALTDAQHDLWNNSYEQFFLIETRVEEKITFDMTVEEKKGKHESVSIGSWRVPDLLDGEIVKTSVGSKNYATFTVEIECIKGVYHNVKNELLPPKDDVGKTKNVRYEVIMQRAENLARKDKHSESDPYVKVKTQKSKSWRFTPALYDQPSPKWMESMKFKCPPGTKMMMNIMDYDNHGKDDFIGSVLFVIPEDLKMEQVKEFSCPVVGKDDSKIYFSIKRMRNVSLHFYKLKYGDIPEDEKETVKKEEKEEPKEKKQKKEKKRTKSKGTK